MSVSPVSSEASREVVVTGAAGFIGAALSEALCRRGRSVIGIDRRDESSRDPLVIERLGRLRAYPTFAFRQVDLHDTEALDACFAHLDHPVVAHLAAQAGIRDSAPAEVVASNIEALRRLLEVLANRTPSRLLFTSSSSVYGRGTELPFHEAQALGEPASLYAQTKVDGEQLVSTFSRESGAPATIVRLFNVYGPRVRADLAVSVFARQLRAGAPISLHGDGLVRRDMTFIDDVTRVLGDLMEAPPAEAAPEIFNVGTGRSVTIRRLAEMLEQLFGQRVERRPMPPNVADLPATLASVERLRQRLGYVPETTLEAGLPQFVDWYRGTS